MPSAQGHLTIMRKAKDGTDGMPGADGQPGEDAIRYWVRLTTDQIVATDITTSTYILGFTKWKQVGQSAMAQTYDGVVTVNIYGTDGSIINTYEYGATYTSSLVPIPVEQTSYVDITYVVDGATIDNRRVSVIRNGENGKDGIQGCILRVSEWAEGVEYHNDQKLTTGTRYLDIAVVTESATEYTVWQCYVTHTSSSTDKPGDSPSWESYWIKFNTMAPIYTPLIMAQNALLRFTQTNQLLVMKGDGTTIAAGMGGGTYPLWVGNPIPSSAPFRVNIDGKMYATNAEITGKIIATSGEIGGFTISSLSLTSTDFEAGGRIVMGGNSGLRAAIGGSSVYPAIANKVAAAFENKTPATSLGSGTETNIAMVVSAQGADNNIAIYTNGGSFACFAMKNRIISNTSTSSIYLDRQDFNVIAINSAQCYLYLPTLGIHDDGHVVRIRRMGNGGVTVRARSCQIINDSGGTTGYMPGIVYDGTSTIAGSSGWTFPSAGDSAEFVWVRDWTRTSGNSTYRGIWVQYKLPQSW